MQSVSIPPEAAPYVLWSTEHITLVGLAGVWALSVLYAWKSWRAQQRHERTKWTRACAVTAVAAHATATVSLPSYREFLCDIVAPLAGGSEGIDPTDLLLAGFVGGTIVVVVMVLGANPLLRRLGVAIAGLPRTRD